MGGSGGGKWSSGGPADIPCENLHFRASVNSPKPTALQSIAVQDILSIKCSADGQSIEVLKNDMLVGALTGLHVASLLNCMHSGFEYQATVLQLDGGLCEVEVEIK